MLKVTNSYVGGGSKFVLGSKFANTCTKGQQKSGVVLWYQPFLDLALRGGYREF